MGRGFGVAANVDHKVIREVAKAAEGAGYSSFWVNDTPGADGLAALGAAAEVTSNLRYGVGVIAVNRRPGDEIIRDVHKFGVPEERLYLGIGSGVPSGALAMIRENTATLHDGLKSRVIVAALGQNMCRVAGEVADGVLFNWLLPGYTAESIDRVEAGAESAGRQRPLMMSYVRCALLPSGQERARTEADRYNSVGNYARHFERQGVPAYETVVTGTVAGEIQPQIAEYEALLDETIVRAITADDTADTILELLEACKPGNES